MAENIFSDGEYLSLTWHMFPDGFRNFSDNFMRILRKLPSWGLYWAANLTSLGSAQVDPVKEVPVCHWRDVRMHFSPHELRAPCRAVHAVRPAFRRSPIGAHGGQARPQHLPRQGRGVRGQRRQKQVGLLPPCVFVTSRRPH